MSASQAYQEWKRTNSAVGCMFARLMATKPQEFGQRIELVSSLNPKQMANRVAKIVDGHVKDPAVAVVTFVFPKLKGQKGLGALAEMACELRSLPEWEVTADKLSKTPDGEVVAVRIARTIPFGGSTCPSEVLVLGPFAGFPGTRKARVAAMEIFVGAPMEFDPKTRQPTKKANLAHTSLPSVPPATFDWLWKKSEEGRRSSLGCSQACLGTGDAPPVCHDPRAKAKVAFVVPVKLATSVGLLP